MCTKIIINKKEYTLKIYSIFTGTEKLIMVIFLKDSFDFVRSYFSEFHSMSCSFGFYSLWRLYADCLIFTSSRDRYLFNFINSSFFEKGFSSNWRSFIFLFFLRSGLSADIMWFSMIVKSCIYRSLMSVGSPRLRLKFDLMFKLESPSVI